MWRPDNWEIKRAFCLSRTKGSVSPANKEAFEAGANAILEVLKKKGEYKTPCEELWLCDEAVIKTQVSGWLVFIPDA